MKTLTPRQVRGKLATAALTLPDHILNSQLYEYGIPVEGSRRSRAWLLAWALYPADLDRQTSGQTNGHEVSQ